MSVSPQSKGEKKKEEEKKRKKKENKKKDKKPTQQLFLAAPIESVTSRAHHERVRQS
jgi:hypothetical protein